MAIGDDTAIDYTNKIIDLTGTTVYNTSVLYSYCKEQFKLSANIDDDFAWTANTPTDFTLKAGWVFRTHGIRRLKNGGIKTAYGLDEIEKLEFATGGYTNAIETDIGKVVVATGLGASDTLVDFDNTRRVWWVRTSGTARSVGDSVSTTITGGTGAGTTTGTSVGSTTGTDDQWTNINTIGDLVGGNTNPYMYVYTGNLGTGDLGGNARKNVGYEDDPDPELTNADRGVLDALIRIKDMGTTLGNPAGQIHVYARTGLDTYSDFPIDISAGGRIAVPISNSNDVEDTLGDYCFAYDGGTAGDFTVGEEITENSATPAWKAEVVADIEGGTTNTVGILVVRGLTALPSNNDTFTGTTSAETGTVRGTAGGQYFSYDAGSDEIAVDTDYGVTLTSGGGSGWTGVLRGNITKAEGTGGITGIAVVETRHDVRQFSTDYVLLGNNETITGTGVNIVSDTSTSSVRLCSDLDDVRIKAAVQRLTGITAGDAVRGDNIIQAVSLAEGTVVEVISGTELHVSSNNGIPFDTTNTISSPEATTSGTPTTAPRDRVFDYAFPLQSTNEYNVLIEGAGRTNAEIYHYVKYFQQAGSTNAFPTTVDQAKELFLLKEELGGGTQIIQQVQGEEYFRAYTDEDTPSNSYTAQDAKSRLCVKNGSTLVTGQGVAIINNASSDANNLTLTNAAGVQISPFSSVVVNITNTVSGDHVQVALDDGSGQEDKAQVTSGAGNTAGNTSIVLNASLPNDTPTGAGNTGVIKMVDDSSTSTINKEMRYRYISYSGTTVTLSTGETGSADVTNANPLILEDTGAFSGTTIQVGDPIRNTTDGSIAWVTELIDNNTIRTTQLEGGGTNDWISGDAWETNTLVVTYVNGTDTGYIPYIDRVANATNEDETLTFVSNRNVVIRVRNTSIIDFDTTGTIGTTGLSVGTVRNPDTVYAP